MNGFVTPRLTRSISATCMCLLLLVAACAQDERDGDPARVAGDTAAARDTSAGAGMDPIARGEQSYVTYCASCHGRDGKGGGPVAEVMTTEPADLTQLRAANDGLYPVDSVYAYIDGRADVRAHGTREMPVWGNVWGEVQGETVPQELVDQRIRELVEYIRTLQDTGENMEDSV